jgi:hypothetical protein
MDDLSMMPMTPLETIAILNKMGLDLSLLEEKTVSLDFPSEVCPVYLFFSTSM